MVGPLAVQVPGTVSLAPVAGIGILALVLGGRDLAALGRRLMVGGWAVFALTTASSEFPTALRPVAVIAVALGVLLHRMAGGGARDGNPRVPLTTRLFAVYLVLVLAGAIVSPYGPSNLFRWFEGVALATGAFYGVSIGLGPALLLATLGSFELNVLLSVASGRKEVSVGVTGPPRLAGYMQSNHLAFAATVVLVGVVWLWPRRPSLPWRLLLLASTASAGFALYESRSRAGLVAMAVGLGAVAASWARAHRRWVQVAVVAGTVVAIVGPVAGPAIISMLSRGSSSASLVSLTGRTAFWPLVVHLIARRPLIGWGIDIVTYPSIAVQFQAITAGAVQAHNAFLEAALMGGIPGAVAWGLSLFGVVVGSFGLPRDSAHRSPLIALSLVIVLYSLTESGPAWFGDMFIVFLLCLALFGAEWKRLNRLPAPLAGVPAGAGATGR